MDISNEEAYSFYVAKTKSFPACESCNEKLNMVASIFIEENSFTESLSTISKKFSRLIDSKPDVLMKNILPGKQRYSWSGTRKFSNNHKPSR